MIKKILKIRVIKVLLCFVENLIKSISIKLWKYIEKKVYNPYDFGFKNINYSRSLSANLIEICDKYNFDISNKNLLELGPGGFLGVGAFLKEKGIKTYYVIDDINHFEKLNISTITLYNKIDRSIIKGDTFNTNYIKQLQYDNGLPLDDNKVDIVFSNAVYEHIVDPLESIKELCRVTKKGGIGIHAIDYRDHIFDQKSLYFLTIHKRVFDFFFKNSGAWVNRKRHSDFVSYFSENGFEILEEVNNQRFNKGGEQKYNNLLQRMSKIDLLISDTTLIVRKI